MLIRLDVHSGTRTESAMYAENEGRSRWKPAIVTAIISAVKANSIA